MKKLKADITQTVRDIDMFGHRIELNFNNKGSEHKTIVGGFFSIYVRLFLLFYFVYVLNMMLTFDNDTLRNSTFTLGPDSNSE